MKDEQIQTLLNEKKEEYDQYYYSQIKTMTEKIHSANEQMSIDQISHSIQSQDQRQQRQLESEMNQLKDDQKTISLLWPPNKQQQHQNKKVI
ncbi:unnamed protein product [Rotaria sp. Silwood2]|nr:unnamed protein product [Rotaria sp. Silwood2]